MRRGHEFSAVFLIGGAVYSMLEILWRGYTHWSMTLTGGLCFLALYALHAYARPLSFFVRCLLGALAVTALEFSAGCVVNLWLGWHVWDYSGAPLNLLGQICPAYTLLWFALAAAAAPICRRLHTVFRGLHSAKTPCKRRPGCV